MNNTNFKWLLFDFDNTLVNFTNTAKKSLYLTFQENYQVCNEHIYNVYKQVNHQVWQDFENGKITAKELRVKRFADLFAAIGEKNINPNAFSVAFLQNLVKASEMYEGVQELLDSLKGKYKMSIVTNGLKEVQRPRLEKLEMTHYFDSIIVSDEIGFKKPQGEYFDYVYQSISNPPSKSEILIIGDSLNSDIRGGRDFGIKTCWNRHGQENTTGIIPDYMINHVLELKDLL